MLGSESIGMVFHLKAKNDASPEIKKFRDDVNKASKDIDENAGSAMTDFAGKLGLTAEQTAALSKAMPIAGAAIAGMAAIAVGAGVAIVGVGVAMFKLAQSAAEVASEIDKFQKITNLSTDTIQALKVAAEASGDSLEQVGESWESFSELIIEAARGNEEAVKKLTRNGLDAKKSINDLEGTFRKALDAINAAPAGFKQNAVAMDLLGESALDLLPTIRQLGGSTDAYIKKLRDQGAIMDSEGIKKAKEFEKQYKALSQQLTGLGHNFATNFIPQFTGGMQSLSKFLTSNKEDFMVWGAIIGDILKMIPEFASAAASSLKFMLEVVNNSLKAITAGLVDFSALINALPVFSAMGSMTFEGYRKQYQNNQKLKAEGSAQFTPAVDVTDPKEEEKKRKEAAEKRKAALQKELGELQNLKKAQIEAERLAFEKANEATEKQLAAGIGTFEDYKRLMLASIDNFSAEVGKLMAQGRDLALQGKTGTERTTIEQNYQNELDRFNKEMDKQRDELNKRATEAEKKAADERIKIAEAEASRKIEIEKARAETDFTRKEKEHKEGVTTETEYAAALGQIRLNSLNFEIKVWKELQGVLDKKSDKYAEISQKIALLDESLKQLENKNAAERIEWIEKERKAFQDLLDTKATRPRIFQDPAAGEEAQPSAGNQTGGGFFDSLISSMAQYLEQAVLVQDANGQLHFSFEKMFETMANLGMQAFEQLTAGFGTMVSNWVLYGDEAGGSLRKMAAQVLANLAGIATQYALMCLAAAAFATTGFGAAILGGTPTQFLWAAAAFGALAVGAAIGGRLLAGDSFKGNQAAKTQNSNAGSGTSSGAQSTRAGGTAYSGYGDDASVVNIGRNTPAQSNLNEVQISFKERSGWFAEMFTVEIRKNGKLRSELRDLMAT